LGRCIRPSVRRIRV